MFLIGIIEVAVKTPEKKHTVYDYIPVTQTLMNLGPFKGYAIFCLRQFMLQYQI